MSKIYLTFSTVIVDLERKSIRPSRLFNRRSTPATTALSAIDIPLDFSGYLSKGARAGFLIIFFFGAGADSGFPTSENYSSSDKSLEVTYIFLGGLPLFLP